MAQYVFGSGQLWGTPTADAYGNPIANPSPVQFGTMQDVSLDISFDTKELTGNLQFAVAIGRGKGKVEGKAKVAQLNGSLFNSLFFGQTLTNGVINDVFDTTGSVIPSSPYSVTPTVPGSGTWSQDLGVRNSNGLPLKRVASAPATGQYTVAAGVYTFAAADTGTTVFINFQYTATSTTAVQSTIINLPMGYAPTFRADFNLPYNGKNLIITLPNCIGSKLSFATKQDDFLIPEFDFSAFASANGQIMTYSLSDI
ncbi:MAG: hypothetical protein JO253_08055 [Alphaproteobacteria bacterium]|nr:hypothetical protein [Alphaproteobacteria bacterium]